MENKQLHTIYLYDSISFCLYHHPQKYYQELKVFSETLQSYAFGLHRSFFRVPRCLAGTLSM